jgi:hypothetical protein
MHRLSPLLAAVLLAWAALPGSASAQRSGTDLLEATHTARLRSNLDAPASTYSSNRDYARREEEAAVSRARALKDAMRGAVASLPAMERKEEPVSTGITDGNWEASRLARIREAYSGARPPAEEKGMLAKMGGVLESMANDEDYIRRRRAGETETGFAPLQRLSRSPEPEGREAAEEGPGLLGRLPLPDVAGAAKGAVGSLGSVADRLQPEPAPEVADSPPARRVMVGAPSQPVASVAPAAAAAAPPAEDAPPTRAGLSLPWNRGEKRDADPEAEAESSPKPKSKEPAAPEPPQAPAPAPPPRKTVSLGRSRAETDAPAPGEPLADPALRVVSSPSGTEFYPYESASPLPKMIPQGAVLQVIKPGDQWSGVVLPDGTEGIIRTGMLRRARLSEVTRPKSASSPGSGGSAPRASAPAGGNPYVEPAGTGNDAPLPQVPAPAVGSMPLGHGLLPPLPPEN